MSKISYIFKTICLGIPIGITFLDYVGTVARVEGISMQPTLNPNVNEKDYVFLSKFAVRDHKIERGDIVSLISPKDPDQRIIKRVVGLQGDTIKTIGYKHFLVKVPEGHFWIEGDHTGNSLDSNSFGPVSLGLMTAKATHIVWPPARWQSIASILPNHRWPTLKQFS